MRQGRLSGTKKTDEKEQIVRTDLKFGWVCRFVVVILLNGLFGLDLETTARSSLGSDEQMHSLLDKASRAGSSSATPYEKRPRDYLKVRISVLPLKLANDSERAYNMYVVFEREA